jgi:hypothetical protein
MAVVMSDSSDSDDQNSDGDDQEEGNRAANKKFPLAFRCLSNEEFRSTDVFESVLDRPREVTLSVQDESEGWGEGLDIGLTWLSIKVSKDSSSQLHIPTLSPLVIQPAMHSTPCTQHHGLIAVVGHAR